MKKEKKHPANCKQNASTPQQPVTSDKPSSLSKPPTTNNQQLTVPNLGYSFQNPDLLRQALTHPSHSLENPDETDNNQRLEFLGDAILGLALAEHLYHTLPDEREGTLTKARAALARGSVLARLAQKLNLAPHLRLGRAEELSGGRTRPGAQEDALEAIIGAIYLDGGYPPARDFILRTYGDFEQTLQEALQGDNPKGTLQEWLQARDPHASLDYHLTDSTGPDHRKTFHVEVSFLGKTHGTGSGLSKKAAEEDAARNALQTIRDHPEQFTTREGNPT